MRKLHVFSCVLLALCISSQEKCLFTSLALFLIGLFIFLVLSCMNCLYILELNSLSIVSFAVIVFHFEGCLSTLRIVSFVVQKLVSLPRSHLYFCFYFHYSTRWVIENLAVIYVRGCYDSFPMSFKSFTPVLLPGKSHGWRSLVGCSPWGREELDTTE